MITLSKSTFTLVLVRVLKINVFDELRKLFHRKWFFAKTIHQKILGFYVCFGQSDRYVYNNNAWFAREKIIS